MRSPLNTVPSCWLSIICHNGCPVDGIYAQVRCPPLPAGINSLFDTRLETESQGPCFKGVEERKKKLFFVWIMKRNQNYGTPTRRLVRTFLQALSIPAFGALTDLEITGQENLPKQGPLIIAGNHFSFIDPVCFVRLAPWQLEFVGGAHMPHAPFWSKIIPFLWGYHPLYRGTGATDSLKAALGILAQGGILGIFPEAGNWAAVLRPARPGVAFIAVQSGAPILPIGLSGLNDVFPSLSKGRRAKVRINIGKPFGPFQVDGKGRDKRKQLDDIGHEIMYRIADLLPPDKRGHYSDDPVIRAAAKGTEIYPWAEKIEGQVIGEVR